MPRNELGTIRRSQIISTYGPGSIVDFRAGGGAVSGVSTGLDQWDERTRQPGLANPQTIFEPRLQETLRVDGFRLPPVAPEIAPGRPAPSADLLISKRFPEWLQCPNCKFMRPCGQWAADPGNPALYCAQCSPARGRAGRIHVVPARFLVACSNGHLDEFPWHRWVGHSDGCSRQRGLKLEGGESAGLSNYILSCQECQARRPMEGCFSQSVLALPCSGRRPWLAAGRDNCGERMRTLQRGASNLYFSVVASALSIPPWTDAVQQELATRWQDLRGFDPDERRQYVRLVKLHERLNMTEDALVEEINRRISEVESSTEDDIRWQEYCSFARPDRPFGRGTEFEIFPEEVPGDFAGRIDKVVRTTRLREVRALVGFTRITPPAGLQDERVAAISVQPKNWLPAIENRGEGVFLRLANEPLEAWESQPEIQRRAAAVNEAFRAVWRQRYGDNEEPPRQIDARLILLHSFAHALIKELSLECGYSSTSLRERLYSNAGQRDMAGVLIYTATPDADGTLGGLARQGKPEKLSRTVVNAVRNLAWCSSDPLCIDGAHSLSEPLNGSACHSCLLVSETSCEEFNCLLDRTFLVGSLNDRRLGFFARFLQD